VAGSATATTSNNSKTKIETSKTIKGLAQSDWPKYRHDNQNTGQSPYNGPIVVKGPISKNMELINSKLCLNVDGVINSDPVIGKDGTIYFGTGDDHASSNYYLYAAKTYKQKNYIKWRYKVKTPVYSSPALSRDGTIFFITEYYLYAINTQGKLKWKYKCSDLYGLESLRAPSPTIGNDGTIYFHASENLYAINQLGKLKWKYLTSSLGFSNLAIGQTGTIFIGGQIPDINYKYNDYLLAITPQGKLKWKYKAPGKVEFIAIDKNGNINFTSPYPYGNYSNLYALTSKGTLKWKKKFINKLNPPAIANNGTIYIENSTYNGFNVLYAFTSNGTPKWKYKTKSSLGFSPVISKNGTIYLSGISNQYKDYLYAFTPQGKLKWKYLIGGEPTSSPIIAKDGTMYFGTQYGYNAVELGAIKIVHFLK
jgi:outer membrane protein assembly factor BamB